jgi:Protein of unknown function (DUF1203)
MAKFKIIPLSESFVSKIKKHQQDDFGHALVEQLATGYGPCRVSLKPFKPGVDMRLLLSYSPFTIDNVFNQSGPIFIHKENVESYKDINRFTPEIKADKVNFPLSLIGFNAQQNMIFTQLVGKNDVDDMISRVFDTNDDIAFLHARNSEACCFICKIERA